MLTDPHFSIKAVADEGSESDFLAKLLTKMIYPSGWTKELKTGLFPEAVIKVMIANERIPQNSKASDIPVNAIYSNAAMDRLQRMCDDKTKPLQVGALLYALYWLPTKLGTSYATVENAAKMVTPPFACEHISSNVILNNVAEYASVCHYWAAYLIIVHPNNCFTIWDESFLDDGITQDSLYDFIANVDIPTFLGYAKTFFEFCSYLSVPRTSSSSRIAQLTKELVWVPEPSSIPPVKALEIPDLWGTGFPVAGFQKKFDAEKVHARQLDKERRARERKKPEMQ
jgi:hypothetical protein